MNIGIIGTGNIANTGHGPAVKQLEDVELVAVLSRNKKTAQDFIKNHGFEAKTYDNINDFVSNKDMELVVITSPDGLHYEQAKVCLEAGKHVLLEKPMTLEVGESEELISLAQQNNLVLAIGFHLHHHNGHKAIKDIIESGEIGEIRHIRVVWAWPAGDDSNWRAHDKLAKWWSLSGVGSHCIDVARWYADDLEDFAKLEAVLTDSVFNGDHDESALISAQFQNGITLDVTSSVLFGPLNQLEIYGTKGSIVTRGTMGRDGGGHIEVNGKSLEFAIVSPFVNQIRNIIGAIVDKSELDTPGSLGLRSTKDLNQILDN